MACLQPGEAVAMNWEGHDDWFLNDAPFRAFTEELPQPLKKAKPKCEDVALNHSKNIYEQVPIPGVNCQQATPEKCDKGCGTN